ncbi:hypothetical protein Leryth_005617 [Lithospermum erythrorhizon]|nr:hypothetical protein Leryth_005617 [Lithospermum erythrorhizon]
MEQEEGETDNVRKRIQPWTRQITVRGIITSAIVGSIYSVIAMKLYLTTGIIPNFNASAALLAFVFIKSWTKILEKAGIVSIPFTPQENTMVLTSAVACYSVTVQGGLASYLLALNKRTYEQAGVDTPGNNPSSYKQLSMGWITGYQFLVCFIGVFVLIPLRKILIIDYKLTYPTGMATAVLINGFHSTRVKEAKKQIRGFIKYFSLSFLWAFFQWFFSGKQNCGFARFPTFGLQAQKESFFFDFSLTYVGTGMICSHIVNLSLLFGAVLSWGVMYPLLKNLKGEWFPADVSEESMKSLNGYKVFISIALLLGDGLYHFVKVTYITITSLHGQMNRRNLDPVGSNQNVSTSNYPNKDEIFIRESIPMWVGVVGYIAIAILTAIVLPIMFHELKWYYIIICYILVPALAFCNAYGTGLTDINMAYNYSKVGLFAVAAMAGKEHGVVAGLLACGLVKSVLSVSCILMQDFKTGHLTLTSPRTMFVSQAIGTIIGCIVAPLTFLLFYKAFDIGNPHGEYKAPFAIIYRNLAIISVEGLSTLPKHCLELCYGFFAFAVGMGILRDVLPKKKGKWLPLPMAMAVPFIIGAYFTIDMCVGSLVVFLWQKINSQKAELMVSAVASGLICGEGLWILPASLLALAKITPPICMKFLPS